MEHPETLEKDKIEAAKKKLNAISRLMHQIIRLRKKGEVSERSKLNQLLTRYYEEQPIMREMELAVSEADPEFYVQWLNNFLLPHSEAAKKEVLDCIQTRDTKRIRQSIQAVSTRQLSEGVDFTPKEHWIHYVGNICEENIRGILKKYVDLSLSFGQHLLDSCVVYTSYFRLYDELVETVKREQYACLKSFPPDTFSDGIVSVDKYVGTVLRICWLLPQALPGYNSSLVQLLCETKEWKEIPYKSDALIKMIYSSFAAQQSIYSQVKEDKWYQHEELDKCSTVGLYDSLQRSSFLFINKQEAINGSLSNCFQANKALLCAQLCCSFPKVIIAPGTCNYLFQLLDIKYENEDLLHITLKAKRFGTVTRYIYQNIVILKTPLLTDFTISREEYSDDIAAAMIDYVRREMDEN